MIGTILMRHRARSSLSTVRLSLTPQLVQQLMLLIQDLTPTSSAVPDIGVDVIAQESVPLLQSDEGILQLYDTVDAEESGSESEDEEGDEHSVEKS